MIYEYTIQYPECQIGNYWHTEDSREKTYSHHFPELADAILAMYIIDSAYGFNNLHDEGFAKKLSELKRVVKVKYAVYVE